VNGVSLMPPPRSYPPCCLRRRRRRGRGCRERERGQASLEWLAVVALVATLLGGIGASLAQAEFVSRRVTRELARAICLVGRGDCRRDQEPCVVGSRTAGGSLAVDLAFVRLGGDRLAVVERRSDGTFAVTIEDGMTGGAAASAGLSARFEIGGTGVSAGGEVAASLLARHGRGRTWIVGSAAEAQRLLATSGGGREPDAISGSGAWSSSLSASAGAGLDGVDEAGVDLAAAGLASTREAGWRVDRRTGHRTAYVQASWSAEGSVGGGVLGLSGAAAGGGEVYAVEFDAAGRPVDLRVAAAGAFGGSRDLPAVVQPVAGLLAAAGAGRAYEVTGHLDLTDATNLAAARDLLQAIAARRAGAGPSRALRRRIERHGTVEARVLATRTGGTAAGFQLVLEGVRLGARAEVEERSQRLLAATSRGLDGQWITRTDCVA
jgi:hypothetical protein